MNQNEIPLSPEVSFVPERSCLVGPKDIEIHLTPNERRLLELIIDGAGKKENIIEEIWHRRGTIVGESSYHQLIKMLRRKLEQVGLPCTVIKTIPRYGITLVPFKSQALSTTFPAESIPETEASLEQDTISLPLPVNNTEHSRSEKINDSAASYDNADIFMKKNIRLSDKKTLIASAIFFTALLLILFCCFFLEKPNPFPYQFKVNGTTFHLATVRNLDRKILMQRKGKVAKEIRHVYIASNGPKVWIAECVNEITKETKCHYENFSSY